MSATTTLAPETLERTRDDIHDAMHSLEYVFERPLVDDDGDGVAILEHVQAAHRSLSAALGIAIKLAPAKAKGQTALEAAGITPDDVAALHEVDRGKWTAVAIERRVFLRKRGLIEDAGTILGYRLTDVGARVLLAARSFEEAVGIVRESADKIDGSMCAKPARECWCQTKPNVEIGKSVALLGAEPMRLKAIKAGRWHDIAPHHRADLYTLGVAEPIIPENPDERKHHNEYPWRLTKLGEDFIETGAVALTAHQGHFRPDPADDVEPRDFNDWPVILPGADL